MIKLVKNKLRVLHFAQIPCEPYIVEVKNEYEAKRIMDILTEQHLFLFNQKIIPDYANIMGVEMFIDEDSEWIDYFNDEEFAEWEEMEEMINEEGKK